MNKLDEQKKFNTKKLQENLMKLMELYKISRQELHKKTGIPITTIQRLCIEKKPNPTLSTLKPIADLFSITINQLIGDDPLPHDKTIKIHFKKRDSWINIPIITWEQAIQWPIIQNNISELPVISTDITVGSNAFALEVISSDLIGFQKGSILIIDPNIIPSNHCFVLTHKKGSETATLKKYLIYDGEIYFEPLNKIFKTVESNGLNILGTVVQLRLDFKVKK